MLVKRLYVPQRADWMIEGCHETLEAASVNLIISRVATGDCSPEAPTDPDVRD